MSPISHSILTSSTLSTAKKLKTPLKASVVLLTTVILASCGSDSGSKSYYSDSTDIPTAPDTDGSETDGSETDGSETDGGETGGGETGGDEIGGGETGSNTDDFDEIKAELEKAKAEAAAQKAKAEAAQKKAEKAQADLLKAKNDLQEAQDALDKAGNNEDKLAAALERADAAEKAEAAAKTAAETAKAAEQAAKDALVAAEAAADKAVGEAKAEADKLVAEAKAETEAANEAAQTARVEADAAKKAADKAKTDADVLVAEANKQKDQAEADALQAQQAADAANKVAADEKARAEKAQQEAETAKSELAQAQKDLEEAEQALADALASGGGNTEALQAEVDRRQAALDAANDKAAAAQQAAADAIAAAQKQAQDAQAALQAANDAAKAAEIKNAPESAKSGVQSLNINAGSLGVFNKTTREFSVSEDGSVIEARADLASQNPETPDQPGLLPKVDITTSAEGDTELDNGFKEHKDNAEITVAALGQTLPLAYTSTYKDFGDDMRIGHIHGGAEVALLGTTLPVDGVAVVGNATKAANMPTEGTVGYTGDATHRKLGLGNAIEFGSSVFSADFVKKSLEGQLSFANAGDIALKAGIDGNQFSGAADANNGYATEGGFYGGDAQYLGGVYEGNGAQGTYGAKSDAQTAAEQAAADAQAAAKAAQEAIAEQQAKAEAAQEAADKAKADAAKAQEALEKAQENLENAGNGEDLLAAALERAAAAEAAAEAAEAAELAAKASAEAALKAQEAAEASLEAEKLAASKAIGEAKDEADKRVAAAQQERDTALAAAQDAETRATAAEAAAAKAKKEAQEAVSAANERAEKAEQEALQAQQDADTANKLAASEKAKAEKAQQEAETAKSELAQAQKDLEEAEQALADALASGGGNTEALQAEVDRRQAALDAANDKAAAAQQAAADAIAAAQKQAQDAQAALQAANDAAKAAEIKNAPESAKSGVQSLNINAGSLGVFNKTTREFSVSEDGSVIEARADLASQNPETPDQPGLLPKVDITTSAEGDTELDNGFKEHKDNAEITVAALGQTLPLAYTSTYKDFGDDMRIGHIHGGAEVALLGTTLPVDGVAVVGNATKAANMPTEGTVGYTGDATHRKLGLGNAIEFGSSVFSADFVKKSLEGQLSFANAGDIALKAGIDGNQFSGAADANNGYATEGGFYGGDAQYLGGVYEGNGAQGTYGAKSDAQTAAEQAAADAQAAAKAAQEAIAEQQAKAEAAQEAADKAKADAAKAQEALEKAQENLENAGNGEDLLAAALERAAAAEAAAEAAEAAELAAKASAEAALKAQEAAEASLEAEKLAASKAIGEAKDEADKRVAAAQQERDTALAAAQDAETKATAAEAAKEEAEERAKAAEDALAAELELPPAPTNPQSPVNATVTGFQNNLAGKSDKGISSNSSSSYDKLSSNLFEKNVELKLTDDKDESYEGEFKKGPLQSLRPGSILLNTIKYTSTYKNFDDEMQIGHVYGDYKTSENGIRLDLLNTVNIQGNSTDAKDMDYMKELSQYNIDNGINDGKVAYSGVASYLGNTKDEIIGKNPIIGTSEFKVDFVDSQVDGKLSFARPDVTDKEIKAVIKGNTFAGNWNGVDTKGGFYGEDAKLLGGIYQTNEGKGTYGAEKVDPEAAPKPTESKISGFQSTALSSKYKELPFGQGTLENAIGYAAIRSDKDTWSGNQGDVASDGTLPDDKVLDTGDNFTAFDKLSVRADMVKPESVQKPLNVSLTNPSKIGVEAGKGSLNPDFVYKSVYENFDQQMQVGHVYGHINSSIVGDVSRVANVYVQGYATSLAGMEGLKDVNEGKAQYSGKATYIENIHLGDSGSFAPVDGTSNFDVDFVSNSVKGELAFDGDFKYNPTGKIGIEATIDGNTFAGNVNGIDTAGGFYGEEAKFLGGIYQDASVPGGKGELPGSGTKFQGTFGAEKQ